MKRLSTMINFFVPSFILLTFPNMIFIFYFLFSPTYTQPNSASRVSQVRFQCVYSHSYSGKLGIWVCDENIVFRLCLNIYDIPRHWRIIAMLSFFHVWAEYLLIYLSHSLFSRNSPALLPTHWPTIYTVLGGPVV